VIKYSPQIDEVSDFIENHSLDMAKREELSRSYASDKQ
jgi:hypothetical protein